MNLADVVSLDSCGQLLLAKHGAFTCSGIGRWDVTNVDQQPAIVEPETYLVAAN